MGLHELLVIGAIISFGLATFGVNVPRINLLALGAFLISLTLVIG